jgi:predicted Zn-dependent protease
VCRRAASADNTLGMHVNKLASFLVVLSVALMSACGVGDGGARARQQLAETRAAGDIQAASVIARSLVEEYPQDAALRLALGEVLLEAHDYAGAHAAALEAEKLGMLRSQTTLVLAQALLGMRKFNEALAIASDKAALSANSALMAKIRGLAQLGLDRPTEARRELAAAVRALPGDVPMLIALSAAVEREEGHAAAVETLQRAAQFDPKNFALRLAVGDAQIRAGDPSGADITFSETIRLAEIAKEPAVVLVATHLAGVAALQMGDVVKARDRLGKLTAKHAGASETLMLQARIALFEGKRAEATTVLNTLLQQDPSALAPRLLLASSAMDAAEFGSARQQLESVLTTVPGEPRALNMLALLAQRERGSGASENAASGSAIAGTDRKALVAAYLRENRTKDALRALDAPPALELEERILLVHALLADGRGDDAKKAAADLARNATDSERDRLLVVRGWAAARARAEVAAALERLRQKPPRAAETWLAIADAERYLGNNAAADRDVAQARKLDPNALAVQLADAEALLQRGESQAALRLLQPLVQSAPNNSNAKTGLARALLAERRFAEAERAAAEAKQLAPADWRPVAVRASALLALGRPTVANAQLADLRRLKAPVAIEADLAGEIAAASRDFSAAAAAFGRGYANEPSGAFAEREFRARLAGKLDDPTAPLRRWLERTPNDAVRRTLLAQYLETVGDAGGAERAYVDTLKVDKDNVIALNNLAWIRIKQGRKDEAVEFAQNAYRVNSQLPQVLDTYGWMLTEIGDAPQGAKLLRTAHERLPDDRSIRYRYAVALARTGARGEAIANLEAATSGAAEFAEASAARALLAQLRANAGQ